MKRKVLKPDIISGGKAIPLGANYYYMHGLKHKDGGIDVGKDPKKGLEVEGEEIMHITPKEVKVFSSVPFLNGKSPAQKVLGGDNPNKVFKQQEDFKDENNINDDGTKKKIMGGLNRKDDYGSSNKPYPKVKNNDFAGANRSYPIPTKSDAIDALRLAGLHGRSDIRGKVYNKYPELRKKANLGTKEIIGITKKRDPILGEPNYLANSDGSISGVSSNSNTSTGKQIETKTTKTAIGKGIDKTKDYIKNHPNILPDIAGTGSNVIGSIIGYRSNKKMLDAMKYSNAPTPRQAAKLKTKININPQLDKMRESVAAYERDVNSNTASSRIGLARKQKARLANMLDTNELYGKKENIETDLINKDKLNQQQVAESNITDRNAWVERKGQFDRAVSEKKAENKIDFVNNINNSVQDLIARSDARRREDNDIYVNEIVNPAGARVMKGYGIESKRSKAKTKSK